MLFSVDKLSCGTDMRNRRSHELGEIGAPRILRARQCTCLDATRQQCQARYTACIPYAAEDANGTSVTGRGYPSVVRLFVIKVRTS